MTPIPWLLACVIAITHVPPKLLDAVAHVESGWSSAAVSRSNCRGVYQICPPQTSVPTPWLHDDLVGRMEAARMLHRWNQRAHGSWPLALQAYRCGGKGLKSKCGVAYSKAVLQVWRGIQ